MQNPSEFLAPGFTPNPLYSKVAAVVADENVDLLQSIVEAAADYDLGIFGNDIPSALIDRLIERFDDELDSVIDAYEDAPEQLPYMPPSPNPVVLYGRIMPSQPILDIGSGDGRKAERSKIRDLVLSDKVVPEGNYSRRWVQLDVEEPGLQEIGEQRVLTSNMLLSQVHNIQNVLDCDGIHIVPDVDYLKTLGAIEANGVIVTRFREKEFKDIQHDYGGGYLVSPGYLGICSFKRRDINILLDRAVRVRPPDLPPISDAKFNLDPYTTPKYDGTQIFFELKSDGTGIAVNRAGHGRILKHDVDFVVQFIAEYIRPKKLYVLLRLMVFRGFVPWHDVHVLSRFCTKVMVNINCMDLYSPDDPRLSKCPSDGMIMRVCELDYRIKGKVTIDMDKEEWSRYCASFDRNSVPYEMVDPPGDEITEYLVHEDDGIYIFERIRLRVDKNTTTDFKTFMYLVGN